MSLLSAAERLAAIDRSEVLLISDRCLHTHEKQSACDQCYEICPEEAIVAGQPPTLDGEKCTGCLACLPQCPTGAFNADDDVAHLLKAAVHVEVEGLELICGLNPQPEQGMDAEAPAIRVAHCLAGLGAGAFVALAAFGFERIWVRGEACADCEWAPLAAELQDQVDQANRFLAAWSKPDLIELATNLENPLERSLWEAKSPPVPRRELFRFMAHQGQMMMARAIEMERHVADRLPGRDRMRLLGAIEHFPDLEAGSEADLRDLGFATLSISDDCTACATCARACPTSALSFEHDEENTSYSLDFAAGLCIGCEICAHVCAPAAIDVNPDPAFASVFPPEVITMKEGKLVACSRCNAPIAEQPGKDLCPICEYRRQNPFGSMLPPGVHKAQQRAVKEESS